MKIKQKFNDYYIGLDLGTNSVGYAVTDKEYNIIKFNKKKMWGSRIFEEAKTAKERRIFRNSRRRLKRRHYRLNILKDFFYNEIIKLDPLFFNRLDESNLYFSDKTTNQKYTLFNDLNFTDKDLYLRYPTIYHLRKDLIYSNEKKDIRIIYLALHHILKKRGHFLFEGLKFEEINNFEILYNNLSEYLKVNYNNYDLENNMEDIKNIIMSNSLKIEKEKQIKKIFSNKQIIEIIKLCIGSNIKLNDLFDSNEFKDTAKKITFENINYDEVKDEYFNIIGEENILLLDICKSIYDYRILANIINEHKYFSDFKVKQYENHKEELKELKFLIKKYLGNEEYINFFKKSNSKDKIKNYPAYIYYNKSNKKEKIIKEKIKIEDFYKIVKNYIEKIEKNEPEIKDIDKLNCIKEKIEKSNFLLKQKNSNNGVIPYQLHEIELLKILENQEKYYEFLSINKDKIIKTFKFKIPYYVGPLNNTSDKAWVVKKEDGNITPWNFDEKIDIEKSAENFIEKLINFCTYLKSEKVIPKNSLLYEEFILLNELNKIKINGKLLTNSQKNDIIENLFKVENNVTLKKFKNYLKTVDIANDDCNITGILDKFNSNMSTYIKFKNIFGEDKIKKYRYIELIEDIILFKCIYGENYNLFYNKINSKYKDIVFSEEEKIKIKNIKFNGFGRLSYKFLNKIDFINNETGEYYESILEALRLTNYNLMELLTDKFNLSKKINEENKPYTLEKTYKELIEESYVSPAIKRTINQTIKIINEIISITKKIPKKIFIETTHYNEKEGKIKDSRKEKIKKLYENAYKDSIDFRGNINNLKEKIDNFDNNRLRQQKLYLYFTQLGRCMYTNKEIDLNLLLNSNIYDIEHIIPQSKIFDDSFDNIILVDKRINQEKGNSYIYEYEKIQQTMNNFWLYLKKHNFISNLKYERLTAQTKPEDEIQKFMNRQLIITQQATKEVINILKNLYPETEIIYSSYRNANTFRKELNIIKCRELNDLHHAKDAYLNIISGNIFDQKFTKKYYLKKLNDDFNFNKIFKINDELKNRVLNIVNKNDVNLNYQAIEEKGQLFNLTICKKGKSNSDIIPFKPKKMPKEIDNLNEKYGYFDSLKLSYFIIFEHENNKKKEKTIERIRRIDVNKIKNNDDLIRFLEEERNYKNVSNVIKVKKGQEIIINNFKYILTGFSNNKIELKNFYPLILPDYETKILKNVINFVEKNKKNNDKFYISFLPIKENKNKNETYEEAIKRYNKEFNHLYITLFDKMNSNNYKNHFNSFKELKLKFENFKEEFFKLPLYEKANFLKEFINLFTKKTSANFEKISGFSEKIIGRLRRKRSTLFENESYLVYKSITGLFEKRIKL